MTGTAPAPFTAYPAIDVREGRVVRLAQGDYARETRYAADPFELAARYAAQGAAWLHLVDLDAARLGGYTLSGLVRRIKRDTGLRVQSGGGVRGEHDVEQMLAAGVDRVVIGSLAVEQPDRVAQWLGLHGAEHITVALDARCDDAGQWWPATHGWTATAAMTLDAVLHAYRAAGMRHLLCTDIARDGMLSGPNLALYAALHAAHPQLAIQASGGARDADDVRAARAAGCSGIVLGKALLEGRLELVDALAAAGDSAACTGFANTTPIDARPPC